VANWCHNLMTRFSSLNSSMALEACVFIVILKRDDCKSNVSLEVIHRPMSQMHQVVWVYNNVVWSHSNELQRLTHNLVVTIIVGIWPQVHSWAHGLETFTPT
jgi:hypothetical protein